MIRHGSPFAFSALALGLLLAAFAPAAPAAAQSGVQIQATLHTDPSRPAGTDGNGRVLLYTPNPFEPGSSVSHWDSSATPDLLMEPSASPLLPFAQLDLTLPAMRDLGWPQGTSTLTLRYQDAAGTGFDDGSLGAQRRAAIELVAQRWGAVLGSSVEINLGVVFTSLPCSNGSGVLAQSGTNFLFESFPGAPIQSTWYHGALAEALSGQNLSLQDVPSSPNAPEITTQFNSQIDQGCLGGGAGYYYGLDGNVPQGKISFVNVALHEVGHGLGFASLSNDQTGALFMGLPDIFIRHLLDIDLGRSWHQLTTAERAASALNTGRVVWNGPLVTAAAPSFLAPGLVLTIGSPASLAGTFQLAPAQFGPAVPVGGLQGQLALGRDGSADPTLGCNPLVNPGEVAGKIAVLDRGACNFTVKAFNAQSAGAIALLVVNNIPGPPVQLGGDDDSIVIPAVHISQQDGNRIEQALTLGLPPQAPSDLTVTPLPQGRSRLTWIDNSDDETGFRIERRREGAGGFQLRANTGPDVTSFEDSGLQTGATYTYRVRAQNGAGASGFSGTASLSFEDLPPAIPGPPSHLRATTLSSGSIALTWSAPEPGEDAFVVQARKVAALDPGGAIVFDEGVFQTVAEVSADLEETTVTGLDPSTTYNLRVQAVNASGGSAFAGPVAATTEATTLPAPCVQGGGSLCLLDDRFQVRAFFKDQFNGDHTDTGTAEPFTSDSGLFWFFQPNNIELVTKMIDASTVTGTYWFFYGALSNVEYWITVTDTDDGSVRTYYNPPGALGAQADTQAFAAVGPTPLRSPSGTVPATRLELGSLELGDAAPDVGPTVGGLTAGALPGTSAGTCQPGPTTLCLVGNRFELTVGWTDPHNGGSGDGHALPLSGNDTTGTFWFFSPNNLELLIKVIDGTGINGKLWVFFGGLTDLPYVLQVRDTVTGNQKTYTNEFGNLVGRTDTDALDP